MEPKNALGKQYKKLFGMNNVSILHLILCLGTQNLAPPSQNLSSNVFNWTRVKLLFDETLYPTSGEATFHGECTETNCKQSDG